MAMMDIGIPSGMTPDMETLDTSKAPMYKRSEMGYRKLSLYFDEVCVFTCYVNAFLQIRQMPRSFRWNILNEYWGLFACSLTNRFSVPPYTWPTQTKSRRSSLLSSGSMIITSPVSTEAKNQRFVFSRSFIYAIHIHVTIKDIHVLPLKIPEN